MSDITTNTTVSPTVTVDDDGMIHVSCGDVLITMDVPAAEMLYEDLRNASVAARMHLYSLRRPAEVDKWISECVATTGEYEKMIGIRRADCKVVRHPHSFQSWHSVDHLTPGVAAMARGAGRTLWYMYAGTKSHMADCGCYTSGDLYALPDGEIPPDPCKRSLRKLGLTP